MEEGRRSSKIVGRQLGSLGWLLEVTPAEDVPESGGEKASVAAALPHITFVLDRSGSMGAWVAYARRAVHAALLQAGYAADTRITFITFEAATEIVRVAGVNPTIDNLVGAELAHIHSAGCTYMAGTIAPVLATLRDTTSSPAHTLIVISDGALHDAARTMSAATDAVQALGVSEVPINGVMLRLQTNSYGNDGDTKALACVASFCTEKVSVLDVNVGGRNEEIGLLTLTQAVLEGLQHTTSAAFAEVRVPLDGNEVRKCLRRMPVDEASAVMRMQCGRTTYVLSTEPVPVMLVNGAEVEVEDGGTVLSEEAFRPFLEFVEQQIKLWTITGANQSHIDAIRDWFQELQSYLSTVEEAALDATDLSIAARTRAMKRAIAKRNGSIISRILQMENSDRVGRLNAQQKADWLRNVDDNRAGRRLAKRAGDVDYTQQSQIAITALAAVRAPDDPSDECVSFYSQSNPTESGVLAAQELLPVVDDITFADALQVIGGVGVPFEAYVSNYPDAFPLRIRSLYCGQLLGEADLWVRAMQSSGAVGGKFECPGRPGSNITGVIALRSSDPAAYDALTSRVARPLFEMQCSAQIRHTVAVAPHDAIALNGAGAWHLIEKLGRAGEWSGVEITTFHALIDNLRHLIGKGVYSPESYNVLLEAMRQPDPRPWLSGDITGNVLKPIVALLRFQMAFYASVDKNERIPGLSIPAVLRALYYIESYHAAKRVFREPSAEGGGTPQQTRDEALRELLGIDLEAHGTALKPLFEAEPAEDEVAHLHYDAVDLEDVASRLPKWMPRPDSYCALDAVLARPNRLLSYKVGLPIDTTGTDLMTLRCNSALLRVVAAVQSLQCASEQQRINTDERTALVPDPTTEEEGMVFLRGVVRGFYAKDYEQRAKAKHNEEQRIITERQIDEMVGAVNYAQFRELLVNSVIVNREHAGFAPLMERLCNAEVTTADRLHKLSLLMTGRDVATPEVPVWANGNFLLNWQQPSVIFAATPGGPAVLTHLRAMRKEYGRHTYRAGHDNRHKHSNAFPSYWALGYKDLYDMRRNTSAVEFQQYINAHCRGRGCCMPNPEQRNEFGI